MPLDLTKPIEVAVGGDGYRCAPFYVGYTLEGSTNATTLMEDETERIEAYRRLFEAAPELLKIVKYVQDNLRTHGHPLDNNYIINIPEDVRRLLLLPTLAKIEGKE